MAEEALADMIRHNGRVVRLPDIEKAVCDVFGLEPASLQSDAKGQASEPSADVGHVARPQAHPRRAERDRPLLRPPQPQHGDLGPEASRRLDGRRPSAGLGRADTGRSTTPFARSSAVWRPASCRTGCQPVPTRRQPSGTGRPPVPRVLLGSSRLRRGRRSCRRRTSRRVRRLGRLLR